jgi:hypothetical protein
MVGAKSWHPGGPFSTRYLFDLVRGIDNTVDLVFGTILDVIREAIADESRPMTTKGTLTAGRHKR